MKKCISIPDFVQEFKLPNDSQCVTLLGDNRNIIDDLRIEGLQTNKDLSLTGLRLGGTAHCRDMHVGENLDCYGMKVGHYAYFNNTRVKGNALFCNLGVGQSNRKGYAYFSSMQVGGDADFSGANISVEADFTKMQVGGALFLCGAQLGDIDLQGVRAKLLDLEGAVIALERIALERESETNNMSAEIPMRYSTFGIEAYKINAKTRIPYSLMKALGILRRV